MAYRARTRSRRNFGGRRPFRRKSDLLPFSDCNTVIALVSQPEADCTDYTQSPGTYAVEFRNLEGRVSGTTPPLDQQLEKLSRGLKFRGMRFQLNMSAPFDLQANVDYQYTTHILCAWTVMNLDPITEAPLELPSFNLFTNSEYDKADILWREAFTLNFGGTSGNIPYQHTFRSREALRDPTFVIKTRRNLRENQALIFVLQTYNLFQDSLNLDFDLFGYAAVQNWT